MVLEQRTFDWDVDWLRWVTHEYCCSSPSVVYLSFFGAAIPVLSACITDITLAVLSRSSLSLTYDGALVVYGALLSDDVDKESDRSKLGTSGILGLGGREQGEKEDEEDIVGLRHCGTLGPHLAPGFRSLVIHVLSILSLDTSLTLYPASISTPCDHSVLQLCNITRQSPIASAPTTQHHRHHCANLHSAYHPLR